MAVLIESTTESDFEDQAGQLDDHIEESVTYYIFCSDCNGGCYDLKTDGIGTDLRDQGWRIRENKQGREFAFCPKCSGVSADRTET